MLQQRPLRAIEPVHCRGARSEVDECARCLPEGFDAGRKLLLVRRQGCLYQRAPGGNRFGKVRLYTFGRGIEPPFENEVLRACVAAAASVATALFLPLGADPVHQLDQLGVAQHDERHRVVTVEIGVQDQLGLVADAGDELAAVRERVADRNHFVWRAGGHHAKALDQRRVQLRAAHVLAQALLHRGQRSSPSPNFFGGGNVTYW